MTDNSHAIENSVIEVRVLKGSSANENFSIDLGLSNYVIRDTGGTDTLTFKNTKIENLEYSYKEGRAYIRDKKTQNIVTFDDNGYATRKINVDKAYDSFNSIYQSIDMDKTLKMESETGVSFSNVKFEFDKMYGFYQKGMIPAALLSESVNNVNSKLDKIINIADSLNEKNSSNLYTTIKKAFHDYTSQLIKLDTNHETVIEKIKIDNTLYDASEVLISPALNNSDTTFPKNISDMSDIADITNVRALKDDIYDYTEKEVEKINNEIHSNPMIEYMAGFKDLGQELGIQKLPHLFDFNPMPEIVMTN
ncbi:Uncharacterised protein [Yersinia aldovae]|uniref:hypothetical protein n=1 Tax=Yersinia aldovae TaxID=29483 RepID=UPI0005E9AC80|nr:hypothetical protein [Yersinia aldovae]CNH55198.1 Uncharacterised protein [Yersinia aldovae]